MAVKMVRENDICMICLNLIACTLQDVKFAMHLHLSTNEIQANEAAAMHL